VFRIAESRGTIRSPPVRDEEPPCFPFLRPAPVLAALVLLAVAPAVRASTLADLGSMSPTTGGFRFSYTASFDGLDASPFATITLEPGDLFTIYDFAGFVPGTNQQPIGWSFSSALTGANPGGFSLSENPVLPNLSWTYTGARRIADGSLGVFSAVSRFGVMAANGLGGAGNTLTVSGARSPSVNVFAVPVPVTPQQGEIPEPGALLLAGIGLLPLAGGMARRRRA
jgi:hypothetical protein